MTLIQYYDEKQGKYLIRDATPGEVVDFSRAVSTVVPPSVTAAQARLALLAAGLLDQVQPAIDALPDDERKAAQIKWDYGATVDRADRFTVALGAALNLSETQMDDLFIAASGM